MIYLQLILLAPAAWLVCYVVWGLVKVYRSGPPSRMATSTRPRPDDRSSIEQFKRMHRP